MSWPGPKLSYIATRETMTRQLTDTKVLGFSLEQRLLFRFGGLACTKGGRGTVAGFLPVPDLALGWSAGH